MEWRELLKLKYFGLNNKTSNSKAFFPQIRFTLARARLLQLLSHVLAVPMR